MPAALPFSPLFEPVCLFLALGAVPLVALLRVARHGAGRALPERWGPARMLGLAAGVAAGFLALLVAGPLLERLVELELSVAGEGTPESAVARGALLVLALLARTAWQALLLAGPLAVASHALLRAPRAWPAIVQALRLLSLPLLAAVPLALLGPFEPWDALRAARLWATLPLLAALPWALQRITRLAPARTPRPEPATAPVPVTRVVAAAIPPAAIPAVLAAPILEAEPPTLRYPEPTRRSAIPALLAESILLEEELAPTRPCMPILMLPARLNGPAPRRTVAGPRRLETACASPSRSPWPLPH